MVDWTHVLVALVAGLPAMIAAASAAIVGWRNSVKIDSNTRLTETGAAAAVVNARAAVVAAANTKAVADNIDKKLNGGLDAAVSTAVAPLYQLFAEHAKQNEKDFSAIQTTLQQLQNLLAPRPYEKK